MDEKTRKALEEYINTFQTMNHLYEESNQAFLSLLDRFPEMKPRWELAKQQRKFAEQVDMSLANKFPFYSALWVCDTPNILLRAGCVQLPMMYTQRHLREAIHEKAEKNAKWHGLEVDQIKRLPLLVSSPVMVMDSLTRDDSIILVTDEYDRDDLPVLITVKANGEGRYELSNISSNFITSVYGKNNFVSFFDRTVKQDKLLYISKNKSQALFQRWGLQLPELTNTLDFDIIIHQSRNIVKGKLDQTVSEESKKQEMFIAPDSEMPAPEKAETQEKAGIPKQQMQESENNVRMTEAFDKKKEDKRRAPETVAEEMEKKQSPILK